MTEKTNQPQEADAFDAGSVAAEEAEKENSGSGACENGRDLVDGDERS